MTDISVSKTSYQAEDRSWLANHHGIDDNENPSVTIGVALFTAGTHYPNGYIPSGTVIGKVTATGLYGPYDNAASDGREVATGLLFGSLPVKTGQTKIGGAQVEHGFVIQARLPFQSGTGSIDTAGKADLSLVKFR